jgi:hypothetical protein
VTAPVELTRIFSEWGPVYMASDVEPLLSTLKEQLANAQSEAKFCREHLAEARELLQEAYDYYGAIWRGDRILKHVKGDSALASLPGGEKPP